MSEDLQYPLGRHQRRDAYTEAEFAVATDTLASQPARLTRALDGLTDAQLDTPYRPGGWTVRQLAHHVADSHVNMYIRLKNALTEDNPAVKTYDQDAWVTLADTRNVPVSTSMHLLAAVHERAVAVLRATSMADRARVMTHPENGPTRVDQLAALYAWHGDHHIAHIDGLRKRMGW